MYIPFKVTVTVPDMPSAADHANNRNKKVIFKICAPFTDCISKINVTPVYWQIDYWQSSTPTFAVNNTKLYIPVIILLTQDNAKLLQQLKSGFKRTINWNKYQSKTTIQAQNQFLDYLIDLSFQGINSLFVLSFENNAHQTSTSDLWTKIFWSASQKWLKNMQ